MPVTLDPWRITGQTQIDSYVERHVQRAVLLVNELTVDRAHGRQVTPPATGPDRWTAIQEALAAAGLPRSDSLSPADADRLAGVAARLRPAFGAEARTEPVIEGLNQLLVRHGAVPNLHGHPDRSPVLAFHRADARLVDAWTADAATALAMVIGVGQEKDSGPARPRTASGPFRHHAQRLPQVLRPVVPEPRQGQRLPAAPGGEDGLSAYRLH